MNMPLKSPLKSEWLENVTYDELTVGRSARLVRTLTLADIQAAPGLAERRLSGVNRPPPCRTLVSTADHAIRQ